MADCLWSFEFLHRRSYDFKFENRFDLFYSQARFLSIYTVRMRHVIYAHCASARGASEKIEQLRVTLIRIIIPHPPPKHLLHKRLESPWVGPNVRKKDRARLPAPGKPLLPYNACGSFTGCSRPLICSYISSGTRKWRKQVHISKAFVAAHVIRTVSYPMTLPRVRFVIFALLASFFCLNRCLFTTLVPLYRCSPSWVQDDSFSFSHRTRV